MKDRMSEEDEQKMPDEEVTLEAPRQKRGFGEGILTGILVTLVGVAVFLAGWRIAGDRTNRESRKQTETKQSAEVLTSQETLWKLAEVQNLIEKNYLGEVDGDLLEAFLFKGAAVGLNDPYAYYYTAEEIQETMDEDRGSYTGIGVMLSFDRETKIMSVHEVYENTPAERAGLEVGDELLEVDGVPLGEKSLEEVVAQIKGKEEQFQLKVRRPSTDETLIVEIQNGEVEKSSVTYEWAAKDVGLIRISEFTLLAVEQFKEAAEALKESGMKALIVDLRGNPGGLLESVCDILDEILPERLLVYTKDRNGNRVEYRSDKRRILDCPVAVLVNGESASASEIFAGAVQDYALGPVVGSQTFGKGIVQKTFILKDGSAFKMTVETYFTPLGQEIHGIGITPDIPVEDAKAADKEEDKDLALEQAVKALQNGWQPENKAE